MNTAYGPFLKDIPELLNKDALLMFAQLLCIHAQHECPLNGETIVWAASYVEEHS